MEQEVIKTEKTGIQKSIIELRKFLPKGFANELATRYSVTPEYVRLVWQNSRENVDIMTATINNITAAKKKKADYDKKLISVIG